MSETETRRTQLRFWLVTGLLAGALVALISAPARSETQVISMGNFFFGDGTINATVGDQLRFNVSTGNNHTVEITELGISSGDLDKGDTYTTAVLTQPGTYRIWCQTHEPQGHEATLIVAAAPTTTTTTTTAPTTTTTTIAGTTTTTIPGGTTTTVPGGTTTTTLPGSTTTTAPGGPTTTTPGSPTTTQGASGTTIAPADDGGTTTTVEGGSGGLGDGSSPSTSVVAADGGSADGPRVLGATSPRIDDAAWLRPVWWGVLVGSALGLIWVGFAWRRRPTEYD